MWLQGMARVKGKRLPAAKQKYRRHAGMPLPAECSSPKDAGKSHKGKKLNQWKPGNMQKAIEEFHAQGTGTSDHVLSIRGLARAWNVPYRTLRNRIVGKVSGCKYASGRPTVLSSSEEQELVAVISDMALVGFPLTGKDVRQLAYDYAEQKGLKVFSEKAQCAGYYWFDNFIKRYPQLSVKRAENLSAARAMAVNETQINKWFEQYCALLERLGVKDNPSHLWNFDETGMQNIHNAKRVVGLTGENAYNVTAMEKGETSTYLAEINAVGTTVPPLIIHKGKVIGKNWKNGAPYDAVVRATPSGGITKEVFLEYGKMFVKFLKDHKLVDGLPHVVVMDNHHSHTFNMEVLQLFKDNSVVVFGLPSHTSHILQPLDKVPFSILKSKWNEQMRLYTRNTGGKALTKSEFFRVFNPCFEQAMTTEHAQAGFRGTGLFPVNVKAINPVAFAPSRTTERALESDNGVDVEPLSTDVTQRDRVLTANQTQPTVSCPSECNDQPPVHPEPTTSSAPQTDALGTEVGHCLL